LASRSIWRASHGFEALKTYSERSMTFRFVSNIDGTDFAEAVLDLDPAETLFIVSSKTFTTLETMTNAATARAWSVKAWVEMRNRLPGILSPSQPMRRKVSIIRHRHGQHVRVLGLGRRTILDGFGDRAIHHAGHRSENFSEMLDGFHEMDEHFRTAPFESTCRS